MTTTCAGCGNTVACLNQNFGEFWYGIPVKSRSLNEFSVMADNQNVSILGHQKLYFCPDCLRAAQQNCVEPQNALDLFAIRLRSAAYGANYRYFTRKDFAQMKFS